MPLDPQARAVLDATAALGLPPVEQSTPEEARLNFLSRRRTQAGPVRPLESIVDRVIAGPGGPIAIRVYRPGPGRLPGLVFFHGGGWVIGDLETHDALCRDLAVDANCVVISVDYRLAPEHPFPAPPEDCYAATAWVAANAVDLDIHGGRIAVAGDSAGGHLAAVVSMMARDRGGPLVRYQLLIYPVTNRDFETEAYRANAEGYGLTRAGMMWFWNHFARPSQSTHPYASPLRAAQLRGLPPAHIITAEYDVLRDDGRGYAERLSAAGVPTRLDDHHGLIHGFFGMTGQIDRAATIARDSARLLGEAVRAG